MTDEATAANTDREIWRETEGDYYSPSLSITKAGEIAVSVGGFCVVYDIRHLYQKLLDKDSQEAYAQGYREGEQAARKQIVDRFEWWKHQTGEDPPWQIVFVDDIQQLRPEDLAGAVRLANEDRRRKKA